MQPLPALTLHRATGRGWARALLAAFVMAVAAAALSPLVRPVSTQWLCSSQGSHVVLLDADGVAVDGAALECAQCLPASLGAPGVFAFVAAPVRVARQTEDRFHSIDPARLWAPGRARAPPVMG